MRPSFPFGIEGGVWDVIVLIPEHCPSIYFSYCCYSLQFTMQNRKTCCLKKWFSPESSKGNFVRENLKKLNHDK